MPSFFSMGSVSSCSAVAVLCQVLRESSLWLRTKILEKCILSSMIRAFLIFARFCLKCWPKADVSNKLNGSFSMIWFPVNWRNFSYMRLLLHRWMLGGKKKPVIVGLREHDACSDLPVPFILKSKAAIWICELNLLLQKIIHD